MLDDNGTSLVKELNFYLDAARFSGVRSKSSDVEV